MGESSTAVNNGGSFQDLDDSHQDFPYARKETVTELPVLQENGQPATETTQIPTKNSNMSSSLSSSGGNSSSDGDPGMRTHHQQQQLHQLAKAEGKVRKIAIRVTSGALMIGIFLGAMYMGHLYICLLVALTELALVSSWLNLFYSVELVLLYLHIYIYIYIYIYILFVHMC
jgi:hypothetical protein